MKTFSYKVFQVSDPDIEHHFKTFSQKTLEDTGVKTEFHLAK